MFQFKGSMTLPNVICQLAVLGGIAVADFARSAVVGSTSGDPLEIIERDVAIIGGGSAGTYSAIRLRDLNETVVVIEREAILGGHTDTYGKCLLCSTIVPQTKLLFGNFLHFYLHAPVPTGVYHSFSNLADIPHQ